jgi:hypothetical protein
MVENFVIEQGKTLENLFNDNLKMVGGMSFPQLIDS